METLHPGLYFQRQMGVPPMEGVSTSTGAFVGVAEKGKVDKAYLITNFSQFVITFGSYSNNSYLAYAVRHFFQNGGSRCYVTRTSAHDTDTDEPLALLASGEILDLTADTDPQITIEATSEGTWGEGIVFDIVDDPSQAESDEYEVTVTLDNVVETFTADTVDELEGEINSRSNLVEVVIIGSDFDNTQSVTLSGGDDGLETIQPTDYLGDSATGQGVYSFDEYDVDIVAVPGITSETVQVGVKDYCEQREDCFGILAIPKAYNPSDAIAYVKDNNLASDYVAIYYPWVEIADPIGVGDNPTKFIPPTGAVAGIYARIDNSRGVWRAPAGEITNLIGVLDIEYNVTDGEQDMMNPIGLNAIRAFDDAGIVVWGARTLSSNAEYKYISTTHLVLFIKGSLMNNMGWAVFENNDPTLWGKITASVSDFLRNLWKKGGLKGETEDEAFWVKCDGEVNTQEVVDSGRLYCDIGIADQTPAEFIVFRLSLK